MAEYCPHCHEFSAAMMAAEGERIAAQAEVARLTEALRLAEADAARLAGVIRDYDVPGCSEWGDAEAAGSFNCDPRCTHSGTECPTRFAALAAHAARLAEGKQ